jgi:hypothetical protein
MFILALLAVLFSCVTFRQKDKSNVKSNIFSKDYGLTKNLNKPKTLKIGLTQNRFK